MSKINNKNTNIINIIINKWEKSVKTFAKRKGIKGDKGMKGVKKGSKIVNTLYLKKEF